MHAMKATKLTTAPQGFEYYRVCDQEGVCRVVRGMWAAKELIEASMSSLAAHMPLTTRQTPSWSQTL